MSGYVLAGVGPVNSSDQFVVQAWLYGGIT